MKSHLSLAVIIAILSLGVTPQLKAAGSDSIYLALTQDVSIDGGKRVLLADSIIGNQPILIMADGSYSPSGPGEANIYIAVDGIKTSNDSLIDWSKSRAPATHSFRAIAALKLGDGKHKIELIAKGSAPFTVLANSNLSVMTGPAADLDVARTVRDSDVLALHTAKLVNGKDSLPLVPLLNVNLKEAVGPVVALASGRSYFAGDPGPRSRDYGDAMWVLSLDGAAERNNNSTYSDNDMCLCAETQAPMFVQGFVDRQEKIQTVTLNGSVEPWGNTVPGFAENGVRYKVGEGATLVVLSGGMVVAGKAALIGIGAEEPLQFNRTPYLCVSSSQNWPHCPAVGTDVTVVSQKIDIPVTHNGVVFFSALTRVQGDKQDRGGQFRMWLVIDGKRKGSEGRQGLVDKYGISTRTVSASYLAAGDEVLTPGEHIVELHAQGIGHFKHLSITRDMPLMWFD